MLPHLELLASVGLLAYQGELCYVLVAHILLSNWLDLTSDKVYIVYWVYRIDRTIWCVRPLNVLTWPQTETTLLG